MAVMADILDASVYLEMGLRLSVVTKVMSASPGGSNAATFAGHLQ